MQRTATPLTSVRFRSQPPFIMNVLVTGGLGYIGSHTVVELCANNFNVIVVDCLSNSSKTVLKSLKKIVDQDIPFYQIDLCDYSLIKKVFEENKIDSIIHFAAFKNVGESVENPIKYYENNIYSLLNLVNCSVQYEVENFVLSSSCTVYGQPKLVPVNEKSEINLHTSPYGRTKIISELVLSDISKISNLKTIALRYFNPIGAHDSGLIGESPTTSVQNILPILCDVAKGKLEKVLIFGGDYNTKDGTAVRDYIDVNDLASAHVKAIKSLRESSSKFRTFNLGSGKGKTVMEIILGFEKVIGQPIPYEIIERREGDAEKIYADSSEAKTELDWEPKKTIEESLSTHWEWSKKNS